MTNAGGQVFEKVGKDFELDGGDLNSLSVESLSHCRMLVAGIQVMTISTLASVLSQKFI